MLLLEQSLSRTLGGRNLENFRNAGRDPTRRLALRWPGGGFLYLFVLECSGYIYRDTCNINNNLIHP